MDRLEAMAVLLRVAERGSFSAASRELGMPLATVSRKVGELEAHLRTRLLLRSTRKVTLTDAGATYLASARRILDEVGEAERVAAGEFQMPRGELVLTAPLLFGRLVILPVVTEFLAAYPDIDVRLLLSDRNLHLIDEHVDMAARIGQLPDSGMIATRIGTMRRVVCASPALIDRFGEPETPEDLGRMPSVNFEFIEPIPVWNFRPNVPGKEIEVTMRPRLSISTAEAAIWAAERDLGVTRVLHYQCADAVRRGALRIILSGFEPKPLPVHLLHAGRGALPAKMRVFLDFATDRLRRTLAAL